MTLKECSNILWMWLGGSCSSYWLSWTNKLMFQYFLIFYTSHPKSAVLLLFKQVSTTLHSPAMKTDSNTSVNHFLQKEKWQYKPLTFSERITITTFFFLQKAPKSSSSSSSLPRNLHIQDSGGKFVVCVCYIQQQVCHIRWSLWFRICP